MQISKIDPEKINTLYEDTYFIRTIFNLVRLSKEKFCLQANGFGFSFLGILVMQFISLSF